MFLFSENTSVRWRAGMVIFTCFTSYWAPVGAADPPCSIVDPTIREWDGAPTHGGCRGWAYYLKIEWSTSGDFCSPAICVDLYKGNYFCETIACGPNDGLLELPALDPSCEDGADFRFKLYDWGLPDPASSWTEYFTLQSPLPQASSPSPMDDATDVSTNVTLNWGDVAGATSYDVYFSWSPYLNSDNLQGHTADNSWVIEPLYENDTRYWRIDTVSELCGITEGEVWSFTTLVSPKCGNGYCDPHFGETCATCPSDCGSCCGNGECDNSETAASCCQDCGDCCQNYDCNWPCEQCSNGTCVDRNTCGDGACNCGEARSSCPQDCGECTSNYDCNWPCEQCSNGTCVDRNTCGDGACNCGEARSSCPQDCGECTSDYDCNWPCEQCSNGTCVGRNTCGDGACNCGESQSGCPQDCGECIGSYDCYWPCEQCSNGTCVDRDTCGDWSCNCGEMPSSCAEDCGGSGNSNLVVDDEPVSGSAFSSPCGAVGMLTMAIMASCVLMLHRCRTRRR